MNTHIRDVYKKGYSTLPNLNKIGEEDVFEKEASDSNLIQAEKKRSIN